MFYIDAGTSFSKIMSLNESQLEVIEPIKIQGSKIFYIIPSQKISELGLKFSAGTGHMAEDYLLDGAKLENEILALAYGIKKL